MHSEQLINVFKDTRKLNLKKFNDLTNAAISMTELFGYGELSFS